MKDYHAYEANKNKKRTQVSHRWRSRYEQLATFVQRHGRMPRPSDPVDAELMSWADNERRIPEKLHPEQVALFNALDQQLHNRGHSFWDERELQWSRSARTVAEFARRVGRLPRRRATNAAERKIAEWVKAQRALAYRGRLTADHVRRLREVPGLLDPARIPTKDRDD